MPSVTGSIGRTGTIAVADDDEMRLVRIRDGAVLGRWQMPKDIDLAENHEILVLSRRRVVLWPWRRHGVLCVDMPSSRVVWQREDLRPPLSAQDLGADHLVLRAERRACEIVDARTGVTLERLRGVHARTGATKSGRIIDVVWLRGRPGIRLADRVHPFPRRAICDVASISGGAVVAGWDDEHGGVIIRYAGESIAWRLDTGRSTPVCLHAIPDGVCAVIVDRDGSTALATYATADGALAARHELPSMLYDAAFIENGSLILADGIIHRLDGSVVRAFT
ncbi:MAG: hypothetical protein H0X45_06710 [Planctomycetes bacterium]|nr:hypothetical protein [Planctomycetota bacterium]